ncbi:LLM class flavin-dependent oxidoreductase [Spongiactinospora gelatinilytica]|uniref:LLM class flavin-dependent oxidoreductase n=1 Tax=Spongiactinospora gelatinilytica TaxID=2666298 RepID=A0A2W2GTX1_9ACTN|nr:LLM class flavin-dependent oxidoreductase [Spongiactinospora gelatinilytica]PZG51372.1 LLM class flavin-dependent oxidoreductase [Spongiactinospora gelatinilytica]
MEIGLALPTTVPDVSGRGLLEWARRAEGLGFSTLGVLDRVVYGNYEPLLSLAAAAAVTERIRLATTVLLAACRDSTLLAKQLATLDHLCGGRLVVGLAAGDRQDDFTATGTSFAGRGKRLDDAVAELRAAWSGTGPGLKPYGRPPLLIGGHSAAAMRRSARSGDGWISGGSSVTRYADLVARVRTEWRRQGRAESPRLVSLCYVSLGPDGPRRAESYLRGYYAFAGEKAAHVVAGVATEPARLRDLARGYAEAGCDELILLPCAADPRQADLVAAAVLS